MRQMKRTASRATASGRALLLFTPILVLLAVAAIFFIAAVAKVTLREELAAIGAIAAASAVLWSMITLHRQIRVRQEAQRDIQSIEARANDLAESAMDPIIELDELQRIVLFNRAAEQVFGHNREAMIGRPVDVLIPERFRNAHHGHVNAFAQHGSTARRMGGNALLSGLRANGEEFPIEASISQHREGAARRLTVILRDVTQRVRAMEELRRSKEELQALAAAAQEAREQEKSRIARELHDELGQQLTMLRMDLTWCKTHLPEDAEGYAAKLDRMEALLKSTVQSTRRLSSDLRPLMLDDLGLVPALEWLVQNMSQRGSVRCEFSIDDPALSLPPAHSTAIFRIVQEALTNIAKHAKAKRAEVAIRRDGNLVRVRVRDDGVGFSPEDPRKPESFGLLGLRERISLLRGSARIESALGEGTTIEIELPVPAPTPT
jgi:PAS domain S-box-containing protein